MCVHHLPVHHAHVYRYRHGTARHGRAGQAGGRYPSIPVIPVIPVDSGLPGSQFCQEWQELDSNSIHSF